MKHLPRKHFGQHFLSDQQIIEFILDAIAPHQNDHFVEIGPGQGALTVPLLARVKVLDAIEIDRDLIAELRKRTMRHGELNLHVCDALTFDFASLKTDERALRIVGNLPYNISTPLLFHLLTYHHLIKDMIFMLQKEVANRIAAAPGSKTYGRLSVMIQYFCETKRLFDVPPSAFYPPPQVQSAVIELKPYVQLPYVAADETLFSEIVRLAFGQRRKTLRNSLKTVVSDEAWASLRIHSDQRAENLSVQDFVEISNAVGTQ